MLSKVIVGRDVWKNPVAWFVAWGMLVAAYVISLQHQLFLKSWDHLIFLIQLACDITIGAMGFFAYHLCKDSSDKKFYHLFFISIIPGLFANEIYNILINIVDVSRSSYVSLYWSVAYSIFLLIQFMAWSYLLNCNIVSQQAVRKKWLTIYPYIQAAAIILLSLIFIVVIRYGTAEKIGNFQIINSVLEIIVFTLMSLCLSRTKNSSLIYLETGFSLLIGFNFAHRFSDMLSIYYKAFDVVWLLCLAVIAYGLMAAVKDRKEKIHFYAENSIHVLTSGAFILFANFILMIFVISAFGMSMLQIDKFPHLGQLALDIPSALVFSYSLTVLLAKFFAYCLSMPLGWVVDRIDRIAENNGAMQDNDDGHFQIDEVKKVENFIIKTISELHHANQVKSEFLMNMSHDFRTPASGIQYMSRLIHDRMSDPELKRLQKMVVNSSEQLMALLEDVLDYSRLENDKLTLNCQRFDIAILIHELIDVMTAKAQERNLSLVAPIKQSPMSFVGDQTIIKRIILNLLSNAIKFTHSGSVTITVDDDCDNTNRLTIRIKDTGIGIDPVNHASIFEPFYRLESADSAKYSGIGLGLSNVKLMLNKIGGEISLVSALGFGSEFIVYLPNGELVS